MLRWRDRAFSRPVIIAAVVMCLYDFLVVLPSKFITYAWPSAPIQFYRAPSGLIGMFDYDGVPGINMLPKMPAERSSEILPGIRASYCFVVPGGAWHTTSTLLCVRIQNNGEQLTAKEFADLRAVATSAMAKGKPEFNDRHDIGLAADAWDILYVLRDGTEVVDGRIVTITKSIARPSGYVLNVLSIIAWPLCIAAAVIHIPPRARLAWRVLREGRTGYRLRRGLCPSCRYERRRRFDQPCPACGGPPTISQAHDATDSAQTADHASPRDDTPHTTR